MDQSGVVLLIFKNTIHSDVVIPAFISAENYVKSGKDTLNVDGPDLENYQPTDRALASSRHIKGHKCTGPRGPRAAAPQTDLKDSDG